MKKSKPEVLLSDVFHSMKAARVMNSIGHNTYANQYRERLLESFQHRIKRARKFPYHEDVQKELTELFFFTKALTGLTKKEAYKMYRNYAVIRKLRNNFQKKEPIIKLKRYPNTHYDEVRLFPLPPEKYHEVAVKVWERCGKPKWGKSRLDGIVFGVAETTWDRFRNRLVRRTIGIDIINKESNGLLSLGCRIADEKGVFFTKKENGWL